MATQTPEPLPRLARRAGAAVLVLLLGFGAVFAVVADVASPARVVPALVVAVAGVVVASFAVDWTASTLPLVAAGVVVICFGSSANAGWFAACALIGAAVWTLSLAYAVVLWAAFVIVLVIDAVAVPDPGWVAWLAGCTFSLVGFATARRQRELVTRLHEAQAGLAAQAQVAERARIARELHDVIAHSLTVSLLHVSAARLALADDPADAERSLAEAERLGRASLDEVRHAVGTLRDAGVDPTVPLPGSTDLAGLFDSLTEAGMPLEVSVTGSLESLPATVSLALYRIVQEALTNAAKHAPGAAVTVRVSLGSSVEVTVASAGPAGKGHGLGLVGMRERAAAVGGTCEAGPDDGGWRVRASLPLAVRT